MKSGTLTMMCGRRLSVLPRCDDVLAVVWTCLPVATLSLVFFFWASYTLSSAGKQSREESKTSRSSRVAGPLFAPMQGPCGQRWKINFTHKKPQSFLAVVSPPVDRNLRSRQECTRAWSWSSEPIRARRQVCSARPHSCSCSQLFFFCVFQESLLLCVV